MRFACSLVTLVIVVALAACALVGASTRQVTKPDGRVCTQTRVRNEVVREVCR